MPVGIYCMKQARERDCSTLPVAAIPLIFGIQQVCEGLVWIGMNRRNEELTRLSAMSFLFFALAFWIFWIPFCAAFLERRRKVKTLLGFIAFLGLIGGATLFFPLLSNPDGLRTTVIHHSVHYDYPSPPTAHAASEILWHGCYLAIVVVPLIVLKNRTLLWFGTALVASAVTSHLYFVYAFASVWCFLAAFLSLYLAYLFRNCPQTKSQHESDQFVAKA